MELHLKHKMLSFQMSRRFLSFICGCFGSSFVKDLSFIQGPNSYLDVKSDVFLRLNTVLHEQRRMCHSCGVIWFSYEMFIISVITYMKLTVIILLLSFHIYRVIV
jgi:hypothetical protein